MDLLSLLHLTMPLTTLVASLVAGVGMGAILLSVLARSQIRQAERDAEATRAATRVEAEGAVREARTRATEERRTLDNAANEELERERHELEEYEKDLREREALVESREQQTRDLKQRQDQEQRAAEALGERARQADETTLARRSQILSRLEERAGLDREAAHELWQKDQLSKLKLRAQMKVRSAEEWAENDAMAASRRIMAAAIDRYNGFGHLERVQNTISIPDRPTLLALTDPTADAYQVFIEEVGCELLADEVAQTLTIRGDDPLGREIARRVLRQLANRPASSANKLRQLAALVKEEVEREVQNAAKRAIRALGIEKMDPEIQNLVGRLKFRLSYSQNQWKHAIEVGHFAGMMAAEMGLDVALARRGGLLHDIGKAITHEYEGSHAQLGAEVARRCGEEELVANAIGAHHNDEPAQSPYAHIVTAADAMSGARPGARRENAASYMGRIQDIQRIATSFPLVERADIMHAGREVRVVVAGVEHNAAEPEKNTPAGSYLKDHELKPLAHDIARALENEVTYAGQIRVTVIRESRSVAIAH
jgi:ribonuclease Y